MLAQDPCCPGISVPKKKVPTAGVIPVHIKIQAILYMKDFFSYHKKVVCDLNTQVQPIMRTVPTQPYSKIKIKGVIRENFPIWVRGGRKKIKRGQRRFE